MIFGLSKTYSIERLFLCLILDFEITASGSLQGTDLAIQVISFQPHYKKQNINKNYKFNLRFDGLFVIIV